MQQFDVEPGFDRPNTLIESVAPSRYPAACYPVRDMAKEYRRATVAESSAVRGPAELLDRRAVVASRGHAEFGNLSAARRAGLRAAVADCHAQYAIVIGGDVEGELVALVVVPQRYPCLGIPA